MSELLFSPTGSEIDWACRRAGYYHTVYACGIEPSKPSVEYEVGKIYHECLANIARITTEPFDVTVWNISAEARLRVRQASWDIRGDAEIAEDMGQIAGGLILAFALKIWPRVLSEWEVVAVEEEVRYAVPTTEAVFRAFPDLLLKHRQTGQGKYVEYKTTSWNDSRWTQQWAHKVQIHAGLVAAQAMHPDIEFETCEVWGFYKGDERDGRVNSPFSYGWAKDGIPGITTDQFSPVFSRNKGWDRFPVARYPGGLREWIDSVEASGLLSKQFPQTAPIFVDRELVNAYLRQQARRVYDVKCAVEKLLSTNDEPVLKMLLDLHFPQNFNSCDPARGHACQFKEICWLASVRQNPIGSGHYRVRERR